MEYLRNRIVTGEFAPGTRLNENEIASRLDISRPPLREAFRVLENEYLAISIPRRGTFVTEMSIEDFAEMMQVRRMTECFAVDILESKNIKDPPLVEEALLNEKKLSLPEENDPDKIIDFYRHFSGFHMKLVESTKNFRMIHFYQAININLARYQLTYLLKPGSVMRSLEEHQQFIEYIRAGAYKEAKDLLQSHIKNAYNFYKKNLPNMNQDAKGIAYQNQIVPLSETSGLQ